MILIIDDALKFLDEAKSKTPNEGWISHSFCVGEAAGKIASALNEKGYDLDIDKAMTLGYIHDIGKMVGPFSKHVMNGYKYLKELGYDDEYANICLTHSYLNNDVNCTGGGIPNDIPFRTNFIKKHQYTIYEKIINLCDLMCIDKVVTIEKRLIDVIRRRGAYPNTQYHINEVYKLKEYFDNILGYDLYNIFPEIKRNI